MASRLGGPRTRGRRMCILARMRPPVIIFALCVLALCVGAATPLRPAASRPTIPRRQAPPVAQRVAPRVAPPVAPPAAPRVAPRGTPRVVNLAGTWSGTAEMRGARLELSVRFTGGGSTLAATLSSPDLLLLDQPLDGVRGNGTHIRFATPDEHPLQFHGVIAGDSMHCFATVPAVPGVIDKTRPEPEVRLVLGRARPSGEPPYSTRELRFTSGRARLAGTLYLPKPGGDLHAGVVLLQGSSSNLRREYRFYADHFARAGLAVLTFDKRGNGESSGDYSAATYDTLASDGAAAVECLRAQPLVDPQGVGVWGLSQGAFIAPRVAGLAPSVRCIVAVSAPGLPIGYSAAYQDSARLASAGFDAADVRRVVSLNRRLTEWLETGKGEAELSALLTEAATTRWRRASSLPARLPSGAALKGWYWRGRTVDPEPWWSAVRVPVLAVYGAADELVPPKPNAKAIERALRKGGDKDVTVKMYPSANHILRTLPLVAGGRWDWPRAAPGYLDKVTEWLVAHTH